MKKYHFNLCSNSKTVWDSKEEQSLKPIELLVKNKYKFNYQIKHGYLYTSMQAEVINNYSKNNCPYCHSKRVVKAGFTKNRIQRFKCNDCKKYFSNNTKTLFSNHKLDLEEYIEFLLGLIGYQSLSAIARNNKNSRTTARYWLQKVFIALKNYQEEIKLKNVVYIDETFIAERKTYIKKVNDKMLRGLSKNQFCIGIGCDKNNVIAFVENKGKPSTKSTLRCFENHIQKGSLLIHDKEKSHNALIEKLKLRSERYDSNLLKNISDSDNPLQKINKQCMYLKKFLKVHQGFNREYLQDYLNLFCFIQNKPNNRLLKAKCLLEKVISNSDFLKYRDFYKVIGKNTEFSN